MNNEQIKHRILSKTVKTSTCWFYTGGKNGGYGALTIDGKKIVVHKLMYIAAVGEIPEGKELDHLCGIKHCVNPEHLQAVSHLENTRRGPQYKGLDQNYKAPSRKKTHLLYIHDDRFREEENKSQLVNELLAKHYADTPKVHDPYKNLIIDTAAGRVADTELGEYIDSDAEMIKELKKRGQVR